MLFAKALTPQSLRRLTAVGVDPLQTVELGAELPDSVVADLHVRAGLSDLRMQREDQLDGGLKRAVWKFGDETDRKSVV